MSMMDWTQDKWPKFIHQKLKHVYESEKETKEKDGDRTDSKRWGDRDSESYVMAREWVAPQRVMCRKVNSECDSIKK